MPQMVFFFDVFGAEKAGERDNPRGVIEQVAERLGFRIMYAEAQPIANQWMFAIVFEGETPPVLPAYCRYTSMPLRSDGCPTTVLGKNPFCWLPDGEPYPPLMRGLTSRIEDGFLGRLNERLWLAFFHLDRVEVTPHILQLYIRRGRTHQTVEVPRTLIASGPESEVIDLVIDHVYAHCQQ